MQKNLKAGTILKKIGIIIAAICTIFCIYEINTKVYSAEIDISKTFKDENLKSAILELAKTATGDESKTTITTSDIEKIVEQPGGKSLRLANKGITDLSGIEVFADKDILRFAGVDRGLRTRRMERGFDVVCNRWQQCFRRRLHPETPRRNHRQNNNIRIKRRIYPIRKPFDCPRTGGSGGGDTSSHAADCRYR